MDLPGHGGKVMLEEKIICNSFWSYNNGNINFAAIFQWFSKQQGNLTLLESDWCCEKLGLTDLLGHDIKLMSDMDLVLK